MKSKWRRFSAISIDIVKNKWWRNYKSEFFTKVQPEGLASVSNWVHGLLLLSLSLHCNSAVLRNDIVSTMRTSFISRKNLYFDEKCILPRKFPTTVVFWRLCSFFNFIVTLLPFIQNRFSFHWLHKLLHCVILSSLDITFYNFFQTGLFPNFKGWKFDLLISTCCVLSRFISCSVYWRVKW